MVPMDQKVWLKSWSVNRISRRKCKILEILKTTKSLKMFTFHCDSLFKHSIVCNILFKTVVAQKEAK